MIDYSIFPHWLGINNGFDLFACIIAIIITFFLYILFGGAICPNSIKNRIVRMLIILFWPIFICLTVCSFPFYMLYEFSKPSEEIDKELEEFIKEYK